MKTRKPTVWNCWPIPRRGKLAFALGVLASMLASPVTAEDWSSARGDAQSTGATAQTLPTDLQVRWEFKADDAIEATPVIANGRVFVGDVMGKLYALNQSDGKEIWSRDFDTGFLASPAVHEKVVVVGDVEGNLLVLSTEDGTEIWSKEVDGEISGSANFHQGNLLVTSQDGNLYCYALADGSLVWKYATDDQIRCSPTVAGDRTFLGGCDGRLHIVDLKTGKVVGEPLPLGGPTGSTPAVLGDRAFLPIMDGVVFAFDWKQAQQLWRYEDEESAQEYRTSAAVAGDVVVVTSGRKQVDAISIQSGRRLWRHTLRRRADASPVIAGDDVFVAATDGRLVRLAIADGTDEKWSYEIRGSFLAAPGIADGQLYIADEEGVVRCFAAKGASLSAK